MGHVLDEEDEDYNLETSNQSSKVNHIKIWYDRTKWIWVLFALTSVVLQATRSADSSEMHILIIDHSELALTFLFDVDILWRFVAHLPDWRAFFQHGNNWLDLMLAVGSSVIQLPVVHESRVYPWLTIFQLARFYRVILEVPRMRPLLVSACYKHYMAEQCADFVLVQLAVFGNLYGLVNMSVFLIIANYLSALVAIQLLRGDISPNEAMNFSQIYNSFVAMYQVCHFYCGVV